MSLTLLSSKGVEDKDKDSYGDGGPLCVLSWSVMGSLI